MLTMTQKIIDALVAHAREEEPIEACGYLAARDGLVCKLYPLTNTDQEAEHYSMDPKEQFAVVREAREEGLTVCAVYHSHPETPARPSEEDINLAYDPNMSYVIVSLFGDEPSVKSFRIRKGVVEVEPIEIVA
jgi:proteasome lid subunit RPN8/RPN11